jgi:hypothetical protein
MYDPKTVDDYIELIDQTLFEIDEVIRCAEDEGEGDLEFTQTLPKYRELQQQLMALRNAIRAGEHRFADGHDLPFMPLVRQAQGRIPFTVLLHALNVAHKKGVTE